MRQQILAIVCYRMEGTSNLFSQLLGTGELINPATKRLLSKSKQSDAEQLTGYLKLHQSAEVELKSLRLVKAHKQRLSELIYNMRGKQQRTSQTRRKAKAIREHKLKAEEVSALQRQERVSVICFAFCLVSVITRSLQNNDFSTFACCLAQTNFKKKTNWNIVLDFLNFFKKAQASVNRLKFLRECLKNVIILDFLMFRVPENGVF